MSLSSWNCKGCTNICHLMYGTEVFTYCRPMIRSGGNRTEWQGDHIACLDYTTDPSAEEKQTTIHPDMLAKN